MVVENLQEGRVGRETYSETIFQILSGKSYSTSKTTEESLSPGPGSARLQAAGSVLGPQQSALQGIKGRMDDTAGSL